MLNTDKSRTFPPENSRSRGFDAVTLITVSDVVRFFLRQWPIITCAAAAAAVLASIYLFTTPPSYTAAATMLIDTRKVQLFQQSQQGVGDVPTDAGYVESQVELLRSEGIAIAVVYKLKLASDPAFWGGGSPIYAVLGAIRRLFAADGPPSEYEIERSAIEAFKKRLIVKRVGLTYALEVSFEAGDPMLAARIANAVAEAYIVDQLDARFQSTKRASVWLQDRIQELQAQAAAADSAVQEFKRKSNIVDTPKGLVNEQQVTEVSSQLILARTQTAEAGARMERIEQVIRAGDPEDAAASAAAVSDVLKNEVITRLQQQYFNDSRREADLSARYGKNHGAAVNLRNQMRELRRVMFEELQRIAQTYRSDYEIAKARQESLQQNLDSLLKQSGDTNQERVRLRQLESAADSYRTIYNSFLQRFMEATQVLSFPNTEARVITNATKPLRKSAPKTILTLAISVVFGGFVGLGLALVRENMDRAIRTTAQVNKMGLECLGLLPMVKRGRKRKKWIASAVPSLESQSVDIFRQVVDEPFSRFAETMRSVKVAIDLRALSRPSKVIGIISATPGEGKSTVAANFARLAANSGHRVLLIDGDLRNPTLTRALAPTARAGLLEVIGRQARLEEVLLRDEITNLHILPAVVPIRIAHSSELLSSESVQQLLEAVRERYAYIVMDLPPVGAVVDVRAAAPLIDTFVLLAEWGRTKPDTVLEVLGSLDAAADNVLGLVLNKVDISALRRFEDPGAEYYSSKRYSKYVYSSTEA